LQEFVQRRLDPVLAPRLGADDVLSEAFLDARRKWPQFRAGSPMSAYAWLYGIVRDRLIEAWRFHTRELRDVRRGMPWPDQSSIQLCLSLVDPASSPSAAAVFDETQQRMREALGLLSDGDREVLWMRYYDSLSFKEVGEILRISEGAATLRHVRALRRLKELWQQLNPESRSRA
jgi:RNA polymerase sigma-70 factor (ECF subfamily)